MYYNDQNALLFILLRENILSILFYSFNFLRLFLKLQMLGEGKVVQFQPEKERLPRESKHKTKYIKAIYVKLGSITISGDYSQTKK